VLTNTVRLSMKDIVHVFSNFSGLRPQMVPSGSHLFTVDRDSCRKSLQLDDPHRRDMLSEHLSDVRWDILATNITERRSRTFNVNDILKPVNEDNLERFMDAFLAGITTIPYFKALTIDGDYYVEGGYMDNTPMGTLFQDPNVDEIIAVDFTDYDYHQELDKRYASKVFTLPLNSIDMHLLVSDMQLTLPNAKIFTQALLINKLLEAVDKDSVTLDGRTYYRKPLHILRPKNLESMTISLKDSTAQKRYFEQGQNAGDQLCGELAGAGETDKS
jgi:predicted acylesterase/phospholipase RssA